MSFFFCGVDIFFVFCWLFVNIFAVGSMFVLLFVVC